MGQSAKPRSAALDAVRLLGIVAIVYGHTWPDDWTVAYLLSPWRVPAFFLLSGYLWSTGRMLPDEARRRTRTLVVPYVAWLGIIAVPLLGWHAFHSTGSTSRLAAGILWGAQLGRPFSAFWFIAALFCTALLVRAIEPLPRWTAWAVCGTGVLAAYAAGAVIAHTPYSLGIVPACAFFVLLGQELKRHRTRIARPAATGLVLLALGGLLIAVGAYTPIDVKYGQFGPPVVGIVVASAVSIGLVLLAEAFVPALPGGVQEMICTLAAAGLAVLLAHAAVLWVVDGRLGWPPWLAFLLALVLPFAVGLAANHTRLAPWITGRERSDRAPVGTPKHPATVAADR
jgi:fucose 4-O-acetylase-like acetyltransferase